MKENSDHIYSYTLQVNVDRENVVITQILTKLKTKINFKIR